MHYNKEEDIYVQLICNPMDNEKVSYKNSRLWY